MTAASGRLRDLLAAARTGDFPAADGTVEVESAPVGPASAVVAFSAHYVVAAPVSPDWVHANLDRGDLAAAHSPSFLQAMGTRIGRGIGALDVVMVGDGDAAAERARSQLEAEGLHETDATDHPRVRRARRYRDDVRVFVLEADAATLVVGRGLTGRLEASFEVAPSRRGRGLGRRLATAARSLGDGEPVWMQVAPGNVASLRAVLAAGYAPVCAEVLFPPAGEAVS